MKLEPRHHEAINRLVGNRYSDKRKKDIAKEVGIRPDTLSTWLRDPEFRDAYFSALAAYRRHISHIRYSDRRERLEELQRLYEAIPDATVVQVIKTDRSVADSRTFKPILDDDGNPVTTFAVCKTNAPVKMKILDQMVEEVGDKVLRTEDVTKRLQEVTDPMECTTKELEMIRDAQRVITPIIETSQMRKTK
jgi:hypothetical protein